MKSCSGEELIEEEDESRLLFEGGIDCAVVWFGLIGF